MTPQQRTALSNIADVAHSLPPSPERNRILSMLDELAYSRTPAVSGQMKFPVVEIKSEPIGPTTPTAYQPIPATEVNPHMPGRSRRPGAASAPPVTLLGSRLGVSTS